MDEHGRWLRTVLLARLGERQAVDDAFQEVAVQAIQFGHRLRDPAKVAPWLYRLAVRAALQYRRREGRRRKWVDRYARQQNRPESDIGRRDPLDWLLADEQRGLVQQALQQLPRRDAEILLLKYSEDWSYRQLADRLGVSVSAVEARLHRARKRLRAALTAVEVVSTTTAR